MTIRSCCFAAVGILLAGGLAAPAAHAQLGNVLNQGGGGGSGGGLGNLGGVGGGLLPGQSLTAGTTGNAAGVLSFCIKNNYLGGGDAAGVRNSLMGKLPGRGAATDPGYGDGARGILDSGNGQHLDLNSVGGAAPDLKAKITKKACDQVLKQGKSML